MNTNFKVFWNDSARESNPGQLTFSTKITEFYCSCAYLLFKGLQAYFLVEKVVIPFKGLQAYFSVENINC